MLGLEHHLLPSKTQQSCAADVLPLSRHDCPPTAHNQPNRLPAGPAPAVERVAQAGDGARGDDAQPRLQVRGRGQRAVGSCAAVALRFGRLVSLINSATWKGPSIPSVVPPFPAGWRRRSWRVRTPGKRSSRTCPPRRRPWKLSTRCVLADEAGQAGLGCERPCSSSCSVTDCMHAAGTSTACAGG